MSPTMSARSADTHSPVPQAQSQQPRRHIGKACEGCRQQKIKCNGELPCERCARLSLTCTVRSVARQRRRQTSHKAPEHDADVVQKALRPVRITNEATGRTAIYGPTSTVALLQLIADLAKNERAISIRTPQIPLPTLQVAAGSGTDLLISAGPAPGVHSRFTFEPYTLNTPPNPSLELSLSPPLCLNTIPNQILETFMKLYVGTAWSICPIQTPAHLGALFASCCTAFSQNVPPPVLYPIILYQLAMGSMFTNQGQLADMLTQESDMFIAAGAQLPQALELQLNILMMQYYSECGEFEKSYTILGTIASKVYAAGFHLQPRSPDIEKLIRILLAGERYIHPHPSFLLFYPMANNSHYSFACIALGRPPLLGTNIHIEPEDQSADQKFFAGIFGILCSSLKIQQNPINGLDELWESIWAVQARLTAFWEENEPLLRFPHTDPHRPWGPGETVALNALLYDYAILTNLRPILLYIGHKHSRSQTGRSASPSPGPGPVTSASTSTAPSTALTTRPRPHPLTSAKANPEITRACEYILVSAKKMVATISDVQRSGSLAKDLPMNSFFCESAVTALVAYGVWYDNPGAVWDSIDLGVRCLETLQYQRAAVKRLANVRRAIETSGLRR
ncbi:hypothetical protein BDW69DRAFT_144461 [Aspergillus filifer]